MEALVVTVGLLATALVIMAFRVKANPTPEPAQKPDERLMDMLEKVVERQDFQLRHFGDRMLSISDAAAAQIREQAIAVGTLPPTPPKFRPVPENPEDIVGHFGKDEVG